MSGLRRYCSVVAIPEAHHRAIAIMSLKGSINLRYSCVKYNLDDNLLAMRPRTISDVFADIRIREAEVASAFEGELHRRIISQEKSERIAQPARRLEISAKPLGSFQPDDGAEVARFGRVSISGSETLTADMSEFMEGLTSASPPAMSIWWKAVSHRAREGPAFHHSCLTKSRKVHPDVYNIRCRSF